MLAKLKRSLFLKSRKHNQREYIVLPDLDMKKLSSQNLEIINRPTIFLFFFIRKLAFNTYDKKMISAKSIKIPSINGITKSCLFIIQLRSQVSKYVVTTTSGYNINENDKLRIAKVRKLISTKFHNTKYSASKPILQIIYLTSA